MRFGFSFPLPAGIRGFISFHARRTQGLVVFLLILIWFLWATGAWARPCATCATITDDTTQTLARDAARPRSTTPTTGASCATISDPRSQAVCRSRNQGTGQ